MKTHITLWKIIVVGLTVTISTSSFAAPRDISAEISPAVIKILEARLPALLPRSITLPEFKTTLTSCWLDKMRFKAYWTKVTYSNLTLKVTPQSGTLSVYLSFSLRATAPFHVSGCGPSLSCTAKVSVKNNVIVQGTIVPRMTGGKLRFTNSTVSVNLSSSGTSIWTEGCGAVGYLVNGALSLLKSTIISRVKSEVNKMASSQVPALLESALGSFTAFSQTFDRYRVAGVLSQVSVSPKSLAVGAVASVSTTQPSACIPPAAAPPPVVPAAAAISLGNDHLGVAISSRIISQAVQAAWRSGLLCLSSADLTSLGVGAGTLTLAAFAIGLTSIDRFDIHAHQPPTVKLVMGTEPRFDIEIPGVKLSLDARDTKGAVKLTIVGTIKARVKLALDAGKNAVVLEPLSVGFRDATQQLTGGAGSTLLKNALDALNAGLGVLLGTRLSRLEVAPQAFNPAGTPLSSYYFYLTRTGADAGYAYAYGKLFSPSADDRTAPTTTISGSLPKVTSPQLLRIRASATDDRTPAALLRYSWRVDGGGWSKAVFDSELVRSFTAGSHTLEARAFDLSGNVDAAPPQVKLEIDGVAPRVHWQQTPPATVLRPSKARAAFTGSDDRTPADKVEFSVQVLHRQTNKLVVDEPLAAGLTSVKVPWLTKGGEYQVRVIARDEAGNLSKAASISFRYDGETTAPPTGDGSDWTGGCSLGASAAAADGLWLMASVLSLISLARRRRRAPARKVIGSRFIAPLAVLIWLASSAGPSAAQKFRFPANDPQGTYFEKLRFHVDHAPGFSNPPLICKSYRGDGFPSCYDGHEGTDFMLRCGFKGMDKSDVEVVAAAAGRVKRVVDGNYDRCHFNLSLNLEPSCDGFPMKANLVEITHPGGLRTRYLHLKKGSTRVKVGQQVACGQVLGHVGSSGRSTGPHLHFEVRGPSGVVIDPFAGPHSQAESYWVEQNGPFGRPSPTCAPGQGSSAGSGSDGGPGGGVVDIGGGCSLDPGGRTGQLWWLPLALLVAGLKRRSSC